MERFKGITIILLFAVGAFAGAAAGKSTSTLLQEGLYAEEVDGDLDAAIKIYQQIVDQSAAQRSHVAQAMYRQGMCYLKKQDETQAREVFAKVVADYGDQTRVIDKVKPLLEELSNGDPAALMPPETLLYIEFGSPGKQVETILKMLKGTPFENPLEAIGAGKGNAQPGPQDILAGLLNPSMMAEFKKIRGIGIGITGVTENDPPVIVVLYPGKSDALRGLLMAGLSFMGKPTEAIEGMQTMALDDGGGAAYDDSMIILASPKACAAGQLTWCVKQHKGLISEPTLASSNKSFAKVSRKDRQDNALTVWANVDEIFTGLDKVLPAEGMPEQYRMIDQFVDLENVDDLISFFSLEEDRIAVETNVSFKDGRQSVAYNLIRTPNLSKSAFNAVPSDAVALISVASPGADSPGVQMLSGKLKEGMGLEISGELFANVDQVTLFALPAS
ncbi:MAG: tetratricopeptide repeat protein, partial [Planctomycetota bacterium]